ncbi:MAG: SDR family NAD(P)-dependent oxidoreductase [Candidatus Schekmanbacteria bacterium]|nr:SDR family NAD(P)-dependent oxidoreductase [Candidatus Schekmanbacteria bacterium]
MPQHPAALPDANRPNELKSWLRQAVARVAGVAPTQIDDGEQLSRYGFSSLQLVGLVREMSGLLDRPLSPTVLWEYPTIRALAHFLATPAETAAVAPAAACDSPRATGEPVAIIGMACRFPASEDVAAFWRLLRQGIDATGEVPPERWDVDAYYSPNPEAPGRTNTRRAAFIAGVELFDPLFFGISPREAQEMDPQQRLALELVWEALEDAGIPAASYRGSRTAVFLGSMWHDWADITHAAVQTMSAHRATGISNNLIANRVSYVFGLRGPSAVIDTACSSALVALHHGCQSLWYGDADLAVVGGVNVLLAPESMVFCTKFGGLSPDGRCKAFDAGGNGFGRGEGGGVVVLKALSRARHDGDRVLCVIRGSAVNNDGQSQGLIAPNPAAQEAVLRLAYRRAGIPGSAVDYVEAHGTGTFLGDPIEVKALGEVVCRDREDGRPLWLGSVKTNINHTEGAAGVAGLIKTILAMRHRAVPASLHFRQPNPHIPFAELGVCIPTRCEPWPGVAAEPAIAGVSAFGWGGTNAHVVLEGAPPDPRWVGLAAASAAELRERAAAACVASEAGGGLVGVRGEGGAHGPHRLAFVSRSAHETESLLRAFAQGETPEGTSYGICAEDLPPHHPPQAEGGQEGSISACLPVVFVCSPLGCQWRGMGRLLAATEPAFRVALARCDEAFRPLLGWSVLEALTAPDADDTRLDDVVYVQPLLFTIQVAIAALLRSWGFEPDAVIGHSAGEPAAAHIAGILDLPTAASVMHHYARVQRPNAGRGAMAVVQLAPDELAAELQRYSGQVVVAAINDSRSTVLSGEREAVSAILESLRIRGVDHAPIRTNVAGHSPLVTPYLNDLAASLRSVRWCAPGGGAAAYYSTVTGGRVSAAAIDGQYFVRNLGQPVRFHQAVQALLADGYRLFVEIGPHPVISYSLQQAMAKAGIEGTALATMRRSGDERVPLLQARSALFVRGAERPLPHPDSVLLPLSGRTPGALRDNARQMATWIRQPERADVPLEDLCYTAALRRTALEHRAGVVGATRESLAAGLDALAADTDYPSMRRGELLADPPRIAFVFPGQGSQWVGMGRGLLLGEPVFRRGIEACEQALSAFVDWSLREELGADEARSRLAENDVVQPVLWAMEVALAELWRSWGVRPDAVVGHSMGEIAAACVAGALSLEDAARVITLRSRIARQHASGNGAMAVVELSWDEAQAAVAELESEVAVGVSNGPRSCVLSGVRAPLERALATLQDQGVFCRWVNVDYASHSPQMEPLRPLLCEALAGLAPRGGSVPMFSTVSLQWQPGEELHAGYWADNLRRPVRFAGAVRSLAESGHTVFVEMSPHPVLTAAIADGLSEARIEGTVIGSLRRGEDERAALLLAAAALFSRGVSLDFRALFPGGGRVVDLPPYAWQKQRYWLDESALAAAPAARRRGPRNHPLLSGAHYSPACPNLRTWECELAIPPHPWLADHRVAGDVIVPAALSLELIISAARQLDPGAAVILEDVAFPLPLRLDSDEPRVLQVAWEVHREVPPPQLPPRAGGGAADTYNLPPRAGRGRDGGLEATVRLFGRDGGEGVAEAAWTEHVRARARRPVSGAPSLPRVAIADLQTGAPLAGPDYYAALASRGLQYGPAFQGIERLWVGPNEVLARAQLPRMCSETGFSVHPALLDAALHAAAAPAVLRGGGGEALVPAHIGAVAVYELPASACWTHAVLRAAAAAEADGAASGWVADVRLLDDDGNTMMAVSGLRLVRMSGGRESVGAAGRQWLHVRWRPAPLPAKDGELSGRWLLVAPVEDAAHPLAQHLTAHGCAVETIIPDTLAEPLGARVGNLALASGEPPLRGVVDLTALHGHVDVQTPVEAVEDAVLLSCEVLMELARTLSALPVRDVPRLVVVTRAAQVVGNGDAAVRLLAAPLWGIAQTLHYEHPELSCTCVDLAPGDGAVSPDEARLVAAEIAAGGPERHVALRDGQRFVARLVRGYPGGAFAGAPMTIRSDGSYLISGGLGGLGLKLARWLVERGARELVLIGRRGASMPAQAEAVAAIRALGAGVTVLACDVADPDQVERAVRASPAPLRGVFHAAGTLDDALIEQQDRDRLRAVMASKVRGAWNLHAATRDRELDLFVLCSSVAATIGSPGQSNYAAANAFLDALAHYRCQAGLAGASINWGAISDVGLAAARADRGARLAARGMGAITAEQACDHLGDILGAPAPAQISVAAFAARQWVEYYPGVATTAFFAEILATEATAVAGAPADRRRLLALVNAAAPGDRIATVETVLQTEVASLMRIEKSMIRRTANLVDLGLDSLIGLELRNRLEAGFGVRLPASLAWTYPRLSALAEHLMTLLEPQQSGRDANAEADDAAARELRGLSDADLAALLAAELGATSDERNTR